MHYSDRAYLFARSAKSGQECLNTSPVAHIYKYNIGMYRYIYMYIYYKDQIVYLYKCSIFASPHPLSSVCVPTLIYYIQ